MKYKGVKCRRLQWGGSQERGQEALEIRDFFIENIFFMNF